MSQNGTDFFPVAAGDRLVINHETDIWHELTGKYIQTVRTCSTVTFAKGGPLRKMRVMVEKKPAQVYTDLKKVGSYKDGRAA